MQIEELTAVPAFISVLEFEAIPKMGQRGCHDYGRENCELIYRNQSGHRRGDRLRPNGRRRYGPGLANAAAVQAELSARL